MNRFITLFFVLIIVTFITGCPKKPTIIKEEAKAPAVEAEKVENEERVRKEAEEKAKAEAETEERARREAEERAKLEAEARAREEERKAFRFEDVHFDFDRYEVKERYREVLKDTADWLLKNRDARIVVEGHCDERGSNEYNLALGDRRAYRVKQYLVTLGVSAARIETISYGEERPVCTESNEDCWGRNRRASFVLSD